MDLNIRQLSIYDTGERSGGRRGWILIRALQDRYDGEKRNPGMSLNAAVIMQGQWPVMPLLPTYSGFQFDMGKLGLDSTGSRR